MAAPQRNASNGGSSLKTSASTVRTAQSGAAESRVCVGASEARVCVGAIAAAHGIKGEVKIKTFTEDPLSVGAYGPVSDETGARQYRLSHLRAPGGAAGDSVVIARLDGIADRNGAEALRGLRLYVPRAALPEAAAGEYYHHDLIGLAAVLVSGEKLGSVRAVLNFGAGDLLEIAPDETGETLVVPFSDAVVPVVDVKAGRVVIDPPDGLLDAGGPEDEEAPRS